MRQKTSVKKTLPKGFLTVKNSPTQNAFTAFFIYLSFLPKGWDVTKLYIPAVIEVRKHFGVDYGFDTMLIWGIHRGCCKSKTSSGRHEAMSEAYAVARMAMGMGLVNSDVTIKEVV